MFTSGIGFSEKYQGFQNLSYPVYKVSDMNLLGNEKYMLSSNNTIDDKILSLMKVKIIKNPSIIFAKVGAAIYADRKRIVDHHFLIDNNMMAFSPNKFLNIEFCYYLFNKIKLSKFAQVGALPSYNASDLSTICVYMPKSEEQERIVEFMSFIDQKIEKQQLLVELLKKYKRSLLTTVIPKNEKDALLFNNKKNYEKWTINKLEDVIDVYSGKDYKHLSEGTIPVYGTGGYMLSVNKALSYDKDAVGIGRKGTIDKPYILKAPFWTVDTLFYAIPKKEIDLDFIYAVFQIVDWKKKDESTGVPSLSKSVINATKVCITHYENQVKIGHLFSTLDMRIELEEKKLSEILRVKTSLLQQLFI